MSAAYSFNDYLMILRRRKWWFIVPALLVLGAAVMALYFWPPTYRSQATILIEEAELPNDLQGMMVSEYVEKRFEAISRRVMVSDSLLAIIDRYHLYPQERQRLAVSKVVDRMRGDISTEMIRANVVDPRSGERRSLTVAFSISFDYGQPEVAQSVTNELVSLYLNENIRQRRERATETATFLRNSLDKAEQRIREVDAQLADFKLKNAGLLPEESIAAQGNAARLESEQRDLQRQIQALKEREAFLVTSLAQAEPYLVYGDNGQQLSPAARLEMMRADLIRLTARYSADHPDVMRLRREVQALEQSGGTGGPSPSSTTLRRERDRLSQQLDDLQSRYSLDHPEVAGTRRELARIDSSLRTAGARKGAGTALAGAGRPDNPIFLANQAELARTHVELRAILDQQAATEKALAESREREAKAPQVERRYLLLRRQLQDATAVREELTKMEASVNLGQSLDTELKAEQLSLIEPPSMPERPVTPNRTLVLLAGVFLALGVGIGSLGVKHLFDDAVWSPRDIDTVLGVMPLAVVPHIPSRAELTLDRLRPVLVVSLLVMLGVLVHTRYARLDVLAQNLQQRVSMAIGSSDAGKQ